MAARNGLENQANIKEAAAGGPNPRLRKESSADSAFSDPTSSEGLPSPTVFPDGNSERSLSLTSSAGANSGEVEPSVETNQPLAISKSFLSQLLC